MNNNIPLDFTLTTYEDRLALVNKILAQPIHFSDRYLEVLTDYLVVPIEKEDRKKKIINTPNRMVTINKRETSFEGLAESLESGEDGIYELIHEDKNMLFEPKKEITAEDLRDIPYLSQLQREIKTWRSKLEKARGHHDAFIIKRALIEMSQDQYVIKNAFKPPVTVTKITKTVPPPPHLDDYTYLDPSFNLKPRGISLMDYKTVSAVLCNYSRLKQESYEKFDSDTYYFMLDFDDVSGRALAKQPLYERIVTLKIDKKSNLEIQAAIEQEFGIHYGVEYLSSLWRHKIPKLIAKEAQSDYLRYEFKRRQLRFKRCSRCGEQKPEHPHFYSINRTSSSGLYSLCKECRNRKTKLMKEAKLRGTESISN